MNHFTVATTAIAIAIPIIAVAARWKSYAGNWVTG